jgi:acetolactate synthase regulatory subunit
MKTPPLLPEETLYRVLRVANFNGFSVLAVAGMMTLAVASTGNYGGAAIGLLIAASGAIELHGAVLLKSGNERGMQWLIVSQPYLLVVVLGYCGLRLANYDPTELQAAMTTNLRTAIAQAGYEEEVFLRMVYVGTYVVFAFVTFIYQGLMTMYYYRRRGPVTAALEAQDEAQWPN